MISQTNDGPDTAIGAIHHVGITVVDLGRATAFWERFLGASSRDRRVLDGPQVGTMVGYPGIRIDSCWIDLPGGAALELLQYLGRGDDPYDPGTAHPGNVHICLKVADMASAHAHALACGARSVSATPIEVKAGPKAGTRLAYLRDPDGVTIELIQPPPMLDSAAGPSCGH
ncbi:MAG: VOC family protein [Actinomycetota bacterium]|nr:VOC family protein [Actinomycetota bacterium]